MPFHTSVLPNDCNNTIFIETGTFQGQGVNRALQMGYKKIHSIELDSELFKFCSKKFKDNQNVTIYQGDSGIVLENVLKNITESATVFLDAHYCGVGSNTGLGEVWIPIEKEITALKNHSINTHIIIVDDLDAMDNSHFDKNSGKWVGSPGLEFILNSLIEINPHYKIQTFKKENQIVAIPTENEKAIDYKEQILMELYNHRVQEKRKIIRELLKKLKMNESEYNTILTENKPLMDDLEKVKIELSKMLEFK